MSDAPVILISGQIAAGKTTAGEMLRDDGFQYARISQAIRTRWNEADGGNPPRSWFQEMGLKLHHEIGQYALCGETMGLISDHAASFVIDGVRWREDITFFRERFGARVFHAHLIAPIDVRRRRFEAREKDVSFDEADSDEVEREVAFLSKEADTVFDNGVDDPGRLQIFLGSISKRG